MGALDTFKGSWDVRHAAHLLRRATFVTSLAKAKELAAMTLEQAVDLILADQPTPPVPTDPGGLSATPWAVTNTTNHPQDFIFQQLVKTWWYELMMKPDNVSALEKMTLFWHNHFATEADVVADSRVQYFHNATLRKHALGNFRNCVFDITIDSAMLRYLNGDTNTAAHANENYARELQELFTIGKGEEKEPGNYTNYTEADIQAAAKILTGWRTQARNGDPSKSVFQQNAHDRKDKTFSSAYGGITIKGSADETGARRELNDLLDMIFAQDETARYIVSKLYRWFVFYEIEDKVRAEVINPLAAEFKAAKYEIKPILKKLFMSEVFFDEQNIGSMIKSPIDFLIGLANQFRFTLPTDGTQKYTDLQKVVIYAATLNQNLMDPPSVAGWQAYYQVPDFYKQWINSATLPNRYAVTDSVVYAGRNLPRGFIPDLPAYVMGISPNASDAVTMISEIGDNIMPAYQLTQEEKEFLAAEVLMVGGMVYEWTTIWSAYKNNQADMAKKKAVDDRLKTLFRYMFRMAEFQLM